MTVSPFKKRQDLRRVRSSSRVGLRKQPQDDWKCAKKFSFPDSPILSRRTPSKRPVASPNDKDKRLPYKKRRYSVLLKRLDLPPAVVHSSPNKSRRTRRQSMVHLTLEDTLQSNINNIPQPIEEESSLKVPELKVSPIRTASSRKEVSKPDIAKKDASKTKSIQKKNEMIVKAQKINSFSEKPTLTSRHKSLVVSEVANSTPPKNKTKRRIEIETVSNVEPSAKKLKCNPVCSPEFVVVLTNCQKKPRQNLKVTNHSVGQKKVPSQAPSVQAIKEKSSSPVSCEERAVTLRSASSRHQTRAVTKKIVPKDYRENIRISPLVTKNNQKRRKKLASCNSSSGTQIEPAKKIKETAALDIPKTKQRRRKTLIPGNSSSVNLIEQAQKIESTPALYHPKTKQERDKTTPEVLKAVRLVPVGNFKDVQRESAKKTELTLEHQVTTAKEGEKRLSMSPEVLKAVRLIPVCSLLDPQIESAKDRAPPPDPEVVQVEMVKPTPKSQRSTRSATRTSKRVRVTGVSPQSSFEELGKTEAPEREDDVDSGSLLISARMQLKLMRNTPVHYKRKPVNRHVQPFTPKPDPPPSHVLRETLKMRVNHELEKETQVEVDALTNGEFSIPDTVNEDCSDVSVLTQDALGSELDVSTTPKSSRQHETLTHSRPVESSCNLDNEPCQQESPPATPRSSTPIEEKTNLDCLTVDPIVGEAPASGAGASTESFDESGGNDNDDDEDEDEDEDDDDSSAEAEECEDTAPPESKRSYCVLM